MTCFFNFRIISATLLLLIASTSCTAPPPEAALRSMQSSTNAEGTEDHLTLGACRIRFRNLPAGVEVDIGNEGTASLAIPRKPFGVFGRTSLIAPLRCRARDDMESIETELSAKQINGEWWPAGGSEYGCEPMALASTGECLTSYNLPFYPEENMQAVYFSGNNWQGTGITVDQITGEEATRQRNLRYCLFHQRVALCGRVFFRNVEPPHYDAYDDIIAALNSIEFVNDEKFAGSPHPTD